MAGAAAAATNQSGLQFLVALAPNQLRPDDLKRRGCGSGFGEGSAGNSVVFHSAPLFRNHSIRIHLFRLEPFAVSPTAAGACDKISGAFGGQPCDVFRF